MELMKHLSFNIPKQNHDSNGIHRVLFVRLAIKMKQNIIKRIERPKPEQDQESVQLVSMSDVRLVSISTFSESLTAEKIPLAVPHSALSLYCLSYIIRKSVMTLYDGIFMITH